jgi:hypothetical protein
MNARRHGLLWILLGVLMALARSEWVWADPVGPFVADAVDTQDPGKFTLQAFPLVGIRVGEYDSGGTIRYAPSGDRDNSFALPLVGIYGIAPNLEISADLTYLYNWKSEAGQSAQHGGIGDSAIKLKYRLFDGGEEGWQPSLSAVGRIRIPLGNCDHLDPHKLGTDELGSGAYLVTLGLNVGKSTEKWQWTANLWYNWPLDTTIDGVQTRSGNFLYYALAGEYALSEKWSVILEFFGQEQGKTEQDYRMLDNTDSRVLYAVPGVGWDISEKFFVMASVSIPLLGKNNPLTIIPGLFFNYNF